MRQIKFRAWNHDKKWMQTVFAISFPVHRNDSVLEYMQFTGLLDKNGKEIYEGDVVKTRDLNKVTDPIDYGMQGLMLSEPHAVVFENCGFSPLSGWTDDALKDMEWEIIGNIYENPELLK